ncbi:hypothetical protein I203_103381 [Kwoniella mangroviensis CBS 8507]|uniref:uncharacterized protein n=1 Tax=Kwoniella mangroviensis CBS 8507 TaxID=1296122 RepID=UPI00080D82E9|nr:uncharacterized protein I203_06088 [Kwoniella mangroviensis CBS 8507]OCF64844.1 hypothetical protein I203_06088 [Kwoniella mangroviensis CBS 8507]
MPYKGLHVVLKKWETLVDWTVKTPNSVLAGVRRLTMDIWPENDSNIATKWPTIIHFLGSLTNLEKLNLIRTPLCRHVRPRRGPTLEELRSPGYMVLSKIRSFAISDHCDDCQDELLYLFLPIMPSVKHLKASGRFPDGQLMTNEQELRLSVPNHVTTFFWKMCGLCDLLLDPETRFSSIEVFLPDLSSLMVSHYDFEENNGCHLRARPSTGIEDQWDIEFSYFGGFCPAFVTFVKPSEDGHWFDLIDDPDGPVFTNKIELDTVSYEAKVHSAMSAGARLFFTHIPSLQTGYFWEPYGEFDSRDYLQLKGCYRWEYRRVTHEDGAWDVEVLATPELLTLEFMANTDGDNVFDTEDL